MKVIVHENDVGKVCITYPVDGARLVKSVYNRVHNVTCHAMKHDILISQGREGRPETSAPLELLLRSTRWRQEDCEVVDGEPMEVFHQRVIEQTLRGLRERRNKESQDTYLSRLAGKDCTGPRYIVDEESLPASTQETWTIVDGKVIG